MGHRLVPLLLIASSTVLAQTAGNNVSAPDAAAIPSAPSSTSDTTSLGSAAPREIVTPSSPSPPGGVVSLPSIQDRFARLDTNHDGFLSSEEVNLLSRSDTVSSSAARFRQMDANHDGKISAAEYSDVQLALERGAIASNPLSTTPLNASPDAVPTGAPLPSQQ